MTNKTKKMALNIKDKNIFLYLFVIIIFSIFLYCFITLEKGVDLGFFTSRIRALAETIEKYGLIFTLKEKVVNVDSGFCGYTTNLFYGFMFLIPCAYLHILGIPSAICFKALILVGVVISWFITYWCLKKTFVNTEKYLLLTLSFVFVFMIPNLGDFLIVKTIRSVVLFCIPLGMYNLHRLFIKDSCRLRNMVGLTLSVTLNLLNHNLTTVSLTLILFIEFIVLAIYFRKTKNIWSVVWRVMVCAIICLGLCASFIFPMIEQTMLGIYVLNYGQLDINGYGNVCGIFSGALFNRGFAEMINIATPAENHGGYFFYVVLLIYLCFKKKNKYYTLISISLIALLLFSSYAALPEIFAIFQFRTRLYALFNPAFILLFLWGGQSLQVSGKKKLCCTLIVFLIINLIFVIILYGCIGIPNIETFDIGGGDYFVYNEEYFRVHYYWQYQQLLQEKNIINAIQELSYIVTPTSQGVEFIAPENSNIIVPLTYYKGYKLYEIIDNQKFELLDVTNYTKDGLIILNNENSQLTNRHLLVEYAGTKIQKISETISIIFIITVFYFLSVILFIRKNININKKGCFNHGKSIINCRKTITNERNSVRL